MMIEHIHLQGDRLFAKVLDSFERRLINGGKLQPGEIAPHRKMRSMDYVLTHELGRGAQSTTASLVTRQGWIFVCTGIQADTTGPYNGLMPSIRINQDEVLRGRLSGGNIGSPAMAVKNLGWIELCNGFGPGHKGELTTDKASPELSEPRDFFRVFGDAAQIETEARLHPFDTETREITIIVHGWEILK
jgi:hypothetical protein